MKYDAGGNPISALREHEYNKRFRFAYDSLGRLVYMSNKEYLNTKVCAWLYDSTGCVAMAVDKPGDSIREMRLLHKEPQPDGTMKLRIIWCRNAAGVDKSEYRQLYNKPDSSLAHSSANGWRSVRKKNMPPAHGNRNMITFSTPQGNMFLTPQAG